MVFIPIMNKTALNMNPGVCVETWVNNYWIHNWEWTGVLYPKFMLNSVKKL